jgi:zinc/manganese transport system substrate-binding protein
MRHRCVVVAVVLGVSVVLALGCSSTTSTPGTGGTGAGSGATGSSPARVAAPSCPVARTPVVVSVDQWGDIVDELAGDCGAVTTIISGSSADPHDYEPTTGDTAKFATAQLVVVNGLDYDPWATKAVAALSTRPAVVDSGEVVGLREGDNPHIWYGPAYVEQVAAAVTRELGSVSPAAATYFADRAAAWKLAMQPYRDAITKVHGVADGKSYGATETVFDYMASAVGLQDRTPAGYRGAAANGSDPAPGDVNAFQQDLRARAMQVFIYNTQTVGAVPEQIRDTAQGAGVPVVNVTESVPPGVTSFQQWQVAQLDALYRALAS